ncbi:hypothetical protein LTR64_000739 [Lithohypha guttulata]|uniref:uncharacterized protein n=1 Tax=Lithohypha guttulata TaxID=1690604 RepID=UPI002DE192E5|nr:hypothetical protein LTR51_005492 [Lithohypha guttulata]
MPRIPSFTLTALHPTRSSLLLLRPQRRFAASSASSSSRNVVVDQTKENNDPNNDQKKGQKEAAAQTTSSEQGDHPAKQADPQKSPERSTGFQTEGPGSSKAGEGGKKEMGGEPLKEEGSGDTIDNYTKK